MLPAVVLTLGGLALAYLPVTFGWADLPDAVSLAPMFLGAVWAWSVVRKKPGRARFLAAVLLTTGWQREHGLPPDIIKGGLCCSGTFDMEPVRLSSRGDYIEFTDEMEDELSPIRHLDRLHAPLIVAYGTCESPEFVRQSREFAGAVAAGGKPVLLIVAENYNHFEVIETLANPHGALGRAVLEQMEAST